jgi:hypothetical protein
MHLSGTFDSTAIGDLEKQKGKIFKAWSDPTYEINARPMKYHPSRLFYKRGSVQMATAKDSKGEKEGDEKNCTSWINVSASAADPLATFLWIPIAPSIGEKLVVRAKRNPDGGVTLSMWGSHSKYPSYELIVNQTLVMGYTATEQYPSLKNVTNQTAFGKYQVDISPNGNAVEVSSGEKFSDAGAQVLGDFGE